MRQRILLAITAVAAGLLAPEAAQAHLVVTGMGPLYDGVTHFALSPEDSLPVLALALYAGLRGPSHARLLLAALPASWFLGGLLMSLMNPALPAILLPSATAVVLLAIGGLLAANAELPPRLCALAAIGLGLVRGAADLAGVPASPSAILDLAGMSVSVLVLFALAASITLPLRRFWMIIAARVAGSWIAAVGLLLAGWIMRFGARVQ